MSERQADDVDPLFGTASCLVTLLSFAIVSTDVFRAATDHRAQDHGFATGVTGFREPRASLQLCCLAFRIHGPDLGQSLKLVGKDRDTSEKHRLDRHFTREDASYLGQHLG